MDTSLACPALNFTVQSAAMLSSFVLAACFSLVSSVSVTDIQGSSFLSPLNGEHVSNLTGLVTAKGPSGFWISGEPVKDRRVSNGLNIFTSSKTILASVNVGDLISLSGTVQEFRSSTTPNNLFGTEISSPSNITVLSSNHTITPLVLGQARSPPTQQLSALDKGPDGFLAVPNNQSLVSVTNATLQPTKFGLDFWESLEGQLVTVRSPTVVDFENTFGEFWVYGDWPVTGKNARGGVTMIFGPDGRPDANPEFLIVGSPLDGTKNPHVAIGQVFQDITGVIVQQFGFFYILPTTAPTLVSSPDFTVPPTTLTSSSTDSCELTIGDYNIDNFTPTSSSLPIIASHIAIHLKNPDLLFIQEIQDNSGSKDDGTVNANVTLSNIVAAIANASGGIQYDFVQIDPVDKQDGGQPGGNIRQVYLYRPDKLKLSGNSPAGDALAATTVAVDSSGKLGLTLNPGRIDPTNEAWLDSRKPLAAVWESVLPKSKGKRFFTINLHLTSKSGSPSYQGDARPPPNLGVDQRASQVDTVATFVKSILAKDKSASIITGGDCNEFIMARSVFSSFSNILFEVDEIAKIPPVERYTYVFDQNNEQLDHVFVSKAIRNRGVEVEHIHVNNWAPTINARASDHDPTVVRMKVC